MTKIPSLQSQETSNEFNRFRELTRLILQVPKSEVDKKLKARIRKRSRSKRKKN